jgi:hypothetical protein
MSASSAIVQSSDRKAIAGAGAERGPPRALQSIPRARPTGGRTTAVIAATTIEGRGRRSDDMPVGSAFAAGSCRPPVLYPRRGGG